MDGKEVRTRVSSIGLIDNGCRVRPASFRLVLLASAHEYLSIHLFPHLSTFLALIPTFNSPN